MTYITNALNAYAGLPQGAAFLVMLPAKTVSGRGGPQAILLNIQYTLHCGPASGGSPSHN